MIDFSAIDDVLQSDVLFYGGLVSCFAVAFLIGIRQERAHFARMAEPPDLFDEIRSGWEAAERSAASGQASSGFDFRRSEAWRRGYMLWVEQHISAPLRRGTTVPVSQISRSRAGGQCDD